MTLQEASKRIGLSERWVRKIIKTYDLPVRKVPYPGGGRYDFTDRDVQYIWEIHAKNQAFMKSRHPLLFPHMKKERLERPARELWPKVRGEPPEGRRRPGRFIITWPDRTETIPAPLPNEWDSEADKRFEQRVLKALGDGAPPGEEWKKRFIRAYYVARGWSR